MNLRLTPALGSVRVKAAIKYLGVAVIFLCTVVILAYAIPRNPRSTSRYTPLRILPLGDSITWGWHPEHKQNGTNGYRARLHHNLVWGRYASVDFVGSRRSGLMHDNENEGYSGYTINKIRGAMRAGLELRPNVVLLHAGTNDMARPETEKEKWGDAPERLGELIDDVLEVCPDAVMIVAKIIQAKERRTAANVKAFNDAIPKIVAERREKGSKVTIVDQSLVGANELVDGLHPSFAAYSHMGDIWFEGINAAAKKGLITKPVSIQS